MYKIGLKICVLIILGLLSNHARGISTGRYDLFLSVCMTLLFSVEISLGYLLFLSNRPIVRKVLGYCFILQLLYPLYLVIVFGVISGGTALLEPISIGIVLALGVVSFISIIMIRYAKPPTTPSHHGKDALFPIFYFLTYTPFIILAVRSKLIPDGLANDYNILLYLIILEMGLSLAYRKLLGLVAPSIILFSIMYIVTQAIFTPYSGVTAWVFIAIHCVYIAAFGVVTMHKFRRNTAGLRDHRS